MAVSVESLRTLVDNLDEYIHVPGGIDRLKKMVLHLAVSGRLVPQDPREGTGKELYQKILFEKAELIKQDKVKMQKQLPPVNVDKIPFGIPQSWSLVRLTDLFDFYGGTQPPKSQFIDAPAEGYVRLLQIRDFGKRPVPTYVPVKSVRRFCSEGDILLGRYGASVGRVCTGMEGAYNVALTKLEFYSNTVDKRYVINYLNEKYFYDSITAISRSAQAGFNKSDLSEILIPLPPEAEQKRIVAKVDIVFTLIDELAIKYAAEQAERAKLVASSLAQLAKGEGGISNNLALRHLTEIIRTRADAKVLRQTILQLAISGQLVPQDPREGTGEELYQHIQAGKAELVKQGAIRRQEPLLEISSEEVPFEIPKTWKWTRLGGLSEIFSGNSINASEKKLKYEKLSDGHPYIATKDIGYGFEMIDYENGVRTPFDESKFKIAHEGTVLICSEGGSAGKKCGIVDRDVSFGNKMYAFRAHGDGMLPDFVLFNYLTQSFYNQFSSKMTGIIGGISTAKFKELLIPLPPLAEQKRIVAKTTHLLDLVDKLESNMIMGN